MNRNLVLILMVLAGGTLRAQTPDFIFSASIGSPQLYMAGNQLAYPIP